MDELFALEPVSMQKQITAMELRGCNALTERYGLSLSEAQIQNMVEKRFAALQDTGRVEFGTGILKKLIDAFCDSPYIHQDNYEETILELQDSFYYFKNESMDIIDDDDLIAFMKKHFDTTCQGSLEYLSGTSLEELCRNTRYGLQTDFLDDGRPL